MNLVTVTVSDAPTVRASEEMVGTFFRRLCTYKYGIIILTFQRHVRIGFSSTDIADREELLQKGFAAQ